MLHAYLSILLIAVVMIHSIRAYVITDSRFSIKTKTVSKIRGFSSNIDMSSSDRSSPQYPQDKFLILGSGSSSRRLILSAAGYRFQVLKADIDERLIGDRSHGDQAESLVTQLAHAKAEAILPIIPMELLGSYLLTADQVVVCNNQILEKPDNVQQAREFMRSYGTHFCRTVGCIALTDPRTRRRISKLDTARIYFDEIPEDVIEALIEEGEVLYCAGGLMMEHKLVQPFIREIRGREDSIMGLSMEIVEDLIKEMKQL